jgi:hypothetical protein
MANFAGHMKIVAADNANALTASGTKNGNSTGALPPGLLDGVVTYCFAGIATATVSAIQLQGSNDGSTWNNVSFDKGTFTAVSTAGSQTFHFAQAQFAQYRTQYTSGALTGSPTVTAVYNFHPVEYSEAATIQ